MINIPQVPDVSRAGDPGMEFWGFRQHRQIQGCLTPPRCCPGSSPGVGSPLLLQPQSLIQDCPCTDSLEKQLGRGTDGLCSAWHLPESGLVLNLPVKDKSSPDLAQLSPD